MGFLKYIKFNNTAFMNNFKGSIKYRIISTIVITIFLVYGAYLISYGGFFYIMCAVLNLTNALIVLSIYASTRPADTDKYYRDNIANNDNIFTKIRHYGECKKPHKEELHSLITKEILDKNHSLYVSYYIYPEFRNDIFDALLANNKTIDYCRWLNISNKEDDKNILNRDIEKMKIHIIANGLYDSLQNELDYISNDEIRTSLTGQNFYKDLPNDYQIGVAI